MFPPRSGLHALFLIAITLLFATGSRAETKQGEIVIGYAASLTGVGAPIGIQTQAGARLAVKELESRGISVNLLVEDNQSDPKVAVGIAKKFIENDRVDAILCDLSGTCAAAAPIASAAKKIMVYQAAADSIADKNEFAFKSFLDYSRGCRAIAELWRSRGMARVGHLKANTEFGELCLAGSQAIFPNQEVLSYNINDDIRSLVTRLSRHEVAFQSGFEADIISRFRVTNDMKKKLPAGIVAMLATETVKKAIGPALEGSIGFGFAPLDPSFRTRLTEAGLFVSESAIDSAAIAYFDTLSLGEAIHRCPRGDVGCQSEHFAASRGGPLNLLERSGRKTVFEQLLYEWRGGRWVRVE